MFFHDMKMLERVFWLKRIKGSGNPMHEATSTSGSFVTDVVAPLKKLLLTLEPIQSGSGTPSPDNIRPISGHTEVVTDRTGANLWDSSSQPSVSGDYNGWHIGSFSNGISVKLFDKNNGASVSGVYFGITNNGRDASDGVTWALANGNVLNSEINRNAEYVSIYPKTAEALTKLLNRYDVIVTIWNGSYPTKYEPYIAPTTYTTTLGRTVYGGTLDVVTGELVVDRAMVDLESLNWTYNATYACWQTSGLASLVKRYTAQADMVNNIAEKYVVDPNGILNGANFTDGKYILGTSGNLFLKNGSNVTKPSGLFVYELATPQTYQLDPQQVNSLIGQNNIIAEDGAEVSEVVYMTRLVGSSQTEEPTEETDEPIEESEEPEGE